MLGEAVMRTLATLAALLVGLAFVFWAPAAKADCPHNDNDAHQHCVGGEPPPPDGASLILVDSDDPSKEVVSL